MFTYATEIPAPTKDAAKCRIKSPLKSMSWLRSHHTCTMIFLAFQQPSARLAFQKLVILLCCGNAAIKRCRFRAVLSGLRLDGAPSRTLSPFVAELSPQKLRASMNTSSPSPMKVGTIASILQASPIRFAGGSDGSAYCQ
ncbi:uncharacterized protein BDZ99DRAFT_180827 [Mytilinidion resinicola]|uniref:Uncharacterized protein n=1 Tax=Mytilinidion resinicola TaxID=574789 RepID=A0A6A6Z1S1_9PEZI|nr:uncharacterized protein BDZ99DRAFT_180827 [Mytilinidion resinicola]KAF2814613.1 hypothetical protein BDZ99DRAFT_180827 [Mytilinidion resinicola]